MRIQDAVHQKYVVAFALSILYVAVLFVSVSSVEINEAVVFVLLVFFYEFLVFFDGIIFSVGVFEKHELLCSLEELRICYHAVFDEDADVVPFLLVIFAVFLEELF